MKPLQPCGTVAAYRRHLKNREAPCAACKAAQAAHHRAYIAANPGKRWWISHPEKARKSTRDWQRKNKLRYQEPKRQEAMRSRHGDDIAAAYAAFWESQDGCCYLCGDPLDAGDARAVHVDHDHRCCGPDHSCRLCRRGLACGDCNAAIGRAHDDPDRMRRMADNLEAACAAVAGRMAGKPEQLELPLGHASQETTARYAAFSRTGATAAVAALPVPDDLREAS